MVNRKKKKKHLLPRFVKYKEGAKVTYDQLRFVFAATVWKRLLRRLDHPSLLLLF